ncbi:uncharacterized protein LOC117813111 [Xyrichtys novacula]|uniref:Uncharacterized protein LOC117813111 n=1 Tax=Xyrichtys novacula TaxID=13765 RepID=A0AAV1FSC2_XYRNO|nr:uncharacterized protein LOC117813111 [Xyrichtys novacula]
MILTGRSLCLPSPVTVQELFFVARDAGIIPDISLDPVLTTFLSLDSSAALQHQYVSLQRSMSSEQQTAFRNSLTEELGGSSRVTNGGVGVVALALSILFDQISQQVRVNGSTEGDLSAHRFQTKRIFGISSSSRIGRIIKSYLHHIPGIANNPEKIAETTELYDNWLKLEIIDHYERMTTKKRMSTLSMQQWLVGAAVHLHIRIHQIRLHSVPSGSAESLRRSYKTGFGQLIQGYTAYLFRNIRETPRPRKPRARTRQNDIFSITNMTCSSDQLFNISLVDPSVSADNETTTTNSTGDTSKSCKRDAPSEDFGPSVIKEGNETIVRVVNKKEVNGSSENSIGEDVSQLGLLVIEPHRNVSHSVQHHPCESPAIQQALVTRIMNALDLVQSKNFFLHSERVLHSLFKQREDFEFTTE